MKNLLFLLTLLSPFLMTAQSSIDIMVGPTFGYRSLSTSSSESIVQTIFDLRERETTDINFTVGINYNHQLSEKWYLRSGIRYSGINYSTKIDNPRWPSQNDGAGGFDPNLPGDEAPDKIVYDHSFLDIAILARRNFTNNKWAPFVEFGVAPTYLLNANNVASTSKANSIQVAAIVSAGMQHTVNKNYQIFAQPAFRYHLVKVVDNVNITENLLGVSLELGVRKFLGSVVN